MKLVNEKTRLIKNYGVLPTLAQKLRLDVSKMACHYAAEYESAKPPIRCKPLPEIWRVVHICAPYLPEEVRAGCAQSSVERQSQICHVTR